MERVRKEQGQGRDEVWDKVRDVPPAGKKWEAGDSEQVENVSAPIVVTELPMRPEHHVMI